MSASASWDAPTLIATKRDGHRLPDAGIDWLIEGYTAGVVAEEQMAALLMAIYLQGMDQHENTRWMQAVMASGRRLDFAGIKRPTVGKHSTGGVGDKITLPLVAVVAACGAGAPSASGRGLGHTGGTLDKMESIRGFDVALSDAQVRDQIDAVGAAIFAAGQLAPADVKLYALRDITSTVASLPLIAASVMSKKLAEGTDALVLDVKVGSGAFMTDLDDARALARRMVELGQAHQVATRALLTDMNTPLGATVGNAIEVAEALDVLAGGGPPDVVALTVRLAAEMLMLAGIDGIDPAQTLRDGSAMDRFTAMVSAQGGDLSAPLPVGACTQTLNAGRGGVMGDIDAMAVAQAAWRLGAGRSRPGQRVQHGAGVRIHRRPGEPVAAGEVLFTLYTDTPGQIASAVAALEGGFCVGDTPPPLVPLIIEASP